MVGRPADESLVAEGSAWKDRPLPCERGVSLLAPRGESRALRTRGPPDSPLSFSGAVGGDAVTYRRAWPPRG